MKKDVLLVQMSDTKGHEVFLATRCERTKEITKIRNLSGSLHKLKEVKDFCNGFLSEFTENLEIIFIPDHAHKIGQSRKKSYRYGIGQEVARRHLELSRVKHKTSPQTHKSVSLS